MSPHRLGRRALLGSGLAVTGAGGFAAGRAAGQPRPASYPFRGTRQAGIVTPAQDRLHFVAFDVTTGRRSDLVRLLREWTLAAERMTRGRSAGPVGAVSGPSEGAPDDTGEALGLPPSRLTLTFGFGPGLFDVLRYLAAHRDLAIRCCVGSLGGRTESVRGFRID